MSTDDGGGACCPEDGTHTPCPLTYNPRECCDTTRTACATERSTTTAVASAATAEPSEIKPRVTVLARSMLGAGCEYVCDGLAARGNAGVRVQHSTRSFDSHLRFRQL